MNLFIVLMGRSSKGRKGVSLGHALRILSAIDPDFNHNRASGLSSGEGLIWAVRDPIVKTEPIRGKNKTIEGYQDVTIDQGVEDKRLLVVESELASVLKNIKREGNTLSPIIRDAWDTGNIRSLTKNSPAQATNAHISIIGHITSQELLKTLDETERVNGFGNRFIWIYTKRSKELPFGGNSDQIDYVQFYKRLEEVVIFSKGTGQITWADETKRLWAGVYHSLSSDKIGTSGSLMNRGEAQVTRLSCIYALLDKSREIKPNHLKAALAIQDYAEDSIEYVFKDTLVNDRTTEILKLINLNQSGVRKSQFYDYFDKHITSQDLDESLKILSSEGFISSRLESTAGKDAQIWFSTGKDLRKKRIKQTKYVEILNSLISPNSQLRLDTLENISSNGRNGNIDLPEFPSILETLTIDELQASSKRLSEWIEKCPASYRTSTEFNQVMTQQRQIAMEISKKKTEKEIPF